MAKAIFEARDESLNNKVTTTPVRDVSRAKKSGPGEFTVKAEGEEARAKVVPGADRTTVYKKLSDNEGYPRGYNPQQMSEVHQAEDAGRLAIFSNSTMQYGRKHAAHEVNLTRQNIARSKFNPTTLDRPLDIEIKPHRAPGEHFTSPTKGRVIIEPGKEESPVLIHEIGHERLETDSAGLAKEKEVVGPTLKALENFLTAKGGHLSHDGRTANGYAVPDDFRSSDRHKLLELIDTHVDTASGYDEGYADKFLDENYVHDPRNRDTPEESMYKTEALIGPFTEERSRLKAFSTGYLASGAKPKDVDDPYITKKYEDVKSTPYPEDAEFSTRSPDHFFTGQNLIDAVEAARAARNSTDNDLRNSNG